MFKSISKLEPYPQMEEAVTELKALGLRICIISPFSPMLTGKILNHWDIAYDSVVSNSDQSNEKGILKSLKRATSKISVPSRQILVFCSTPAQIQTANALGNISVYCSFSINQEDSLIPYASMKISDWSELSAITSLLQNQPTYPSIV